MRQYTKKEYDQYLEKFAERHAPGSKYPEAKPISFKRWKEFQPVSDRVADQVGRAFRALSEK